MKKKMILTLFFAALLCVSCGRQGGSSLPELLTPVAVKLDTAEVVRGDVTDMALWEGSVVPACIDLSFSVSGILGKIYVSAGDVVEKGDIIAELDSTSLDAGMEELRRQLSDKEEKYAFSSEQSNLELEILRVQLDALKADESSLNFQLKQLEIEEKQREIEYERQSYLLAVQELENKISLLRLQEQNRVLTAPASGKVAYTLSAFGGEMVKEGTVIASITDGGSLYVTCEFIPALEIAESVRCYAKIGGKDYPLSYREMERSLYLEKVLAGEEVSSLFEIEGEPDVSCGDYASVYLLYQEEKDVLYVPTNGIYSEGGQKYVYKMDGDSRVRCDVEIGLQTDAKTVILSGLAEGEMIYVKK